MTQIIFFAFSMASFAFADYGANLIHDGQRFLSADKTTEATIEKGVKSFTLSKNKKKLYRVVPAIPNFRLGRLFVANDGKIVVWMLERHFYGEQGKPPVDLPALVFFVDGKPIKTWNYGVLMSRPELVWYTTSHTAWIAEPKNRDWSPGKQMMFAPDGSRLEFETTSFREYVFDPRTGEQLKGEDSPVFRDSDLIISGQISPRSHSDVNSGEWNIEPLYVIKNISNKVENKIEFRDPSKSYTRTGKFTVALKRVGDRWETIREAWQMPPLLVPHSQNSEIGK